MDISDTKHHENEVNECSSSYDSVTRTRTPASTRNEELACTGGLRAGGWPDDGSLRARSASVRRRASLAALLRGVIAASVAVVSKTHAGRGMVDTI